MQHGDDLEPARLLLESGALTEAVEALDVIRRRDPDDPVASHLLGLAHYRAGAFQEAAAAFGRAIALTPDTPAAELSFWHGMALVKSGAVAEAIPELERGATAGHLEARYQLALQYAREGRRQRDKRQRAVAHLEAILTAAESDDGPRTLVASLDRVCFTLGGLYLEADGDDESLERGIAVYRRGLAINPLSAGGHHNLGLLLEKMVRYLAALGEYKLAIQLDPDHRAAYRSLARLLCEHVDGDDLAAEFAQMVEEFGASTPRVLAALAAEMVEQGREQAQREMYTKSHQLKNLLGLVGSRLRRVGRKLTSREEARGQDMASFVDEVGDEMRGVEAEYERLFEEWVGYLAALTPDTLYTSLIEPGRVVERVLEALRPTAGDVRLQLRSQEGVPRIQADERLLREAVTNLCLNALEATAGQTVAAGVISVGVGFDVGAGVVYVEVEDDGPGIAPESIDHVFAPGFTTKRKGSGYGLSIARRIALAHHGDLRVKSKVGHGSVFRLDVPVNFDTESAPVTLAGGV